MAQGCLAGGIVLLVITLFLGVLFAAGSVPMFGIIFGVIFGIPGLLMVILGGLFHKKKANAYLSYCQKESGYDMEEIKRVDQELFASDVICIGNIRPETKEKRPRIGCYITKHYIILPMVLGDIYIRRIEDMAAVFYCETIPGVGGYKHGLVFGSKQDDRPSYNAAMNKESCSQITQILCERNPQIIINQFVVRDGVQYDLTKDWGKCH